MGKGGDDDGEGAVGMCFIGMLALITWGMSRWFEAMTAQVQTYTSASLPRLHLAPKLPSYLPPPERVRAGGDRHSLLWRALRGRYKCERRARACSC